MSATTFTTDVPMGYSTNYICEATELGLKYSVSSASDVNTHNLSAVSKVFSTFTTLNVSQHYFTSASDIPVGNIDGGTWPASDLSYSVLTYDILSTSGTSTLTVCTNPYQLPMLTGTITYHPQKLTTSTVGVGNSGTGEAMFTDTPRLLA